MTSCFTSASISRMRATSIARAWPGSRAPPRPAPRRARRAPRSARLDLEPVREARLLRPERAHRGARVPVDHFWGPLRCSRASRAAYELPRASAPRPDPVARLGKASLGLHREPTGTTEAAFAARARGQRGRLAPCDARDRADDELRDSVAAPRRTGSRPRFTSSTWISPR